MDVAAINVEDKWVGFFFVRASREWLEMKCLEISISFQNDHA
jgi:hypothetical protein